MLTESIIPALTLMPRPNAHLLVPPLVAGTVFWLVVVARRRGINLRFVAYFALVVVVAWTATAIMLPLHAQVTAPAVTPSSEGFWDIQYMPDSVRILLGISFGAMVPIMMAIGDRVPWRMWSYSVLVALPVVYLALALVVPPGVGDYGFLLVALVWLILLPGALGTLLWSIPTRPSSQQAKLQG